MRILVVGAGSTGGYFGGRLLQAGRDVTFLVRSGRARQLRVSGLQILSSHGDVTLTPRLVCAGEIRSPYDVILLAVKAYSLTQALEEPGAGGWQRHSDPADAQRHAAYRYDSQSFRR